MSTLQIQMATHHTYTDTHHKRWGLYYRLAGRLTPAASVEVHIIQHSVPDI